MSQGITIKGKTADGKNVEIRVTENGLLEAAVQTSHTVKFASVNVSSPGDNELVAAVADKKIKVLSAAIIAAGTVAVKWRSDTSDRSGAMPLLASSGFVLPASLPAAGYYIETASGEALGLNLSAGVAVTGHISYYEE